MNMMDLRRELARRFVELCAAVVNWPLYYFAQTYMDIAHALVDASKTLDARTIVVLSKIATEQEEALELLKAYDAHKGHEAACELAAEIDAKNAERYSKVIPIVLRGTPQDAPPDEPAPSVPLLGPNGASAHREAAEIAADLGAFVGRGGDA